MLYNIIKINESRFREYTSRPTKGTNKFIFITISIICNTTKSTTF